MTFRAISIKWKNRGCFISSQTWKILECPRTKNLLLFSHGWKSYSSASDKLCPWLWWRQKPDSIRWQQEITPTHFFPNIKLTCEMQTQCRGSFIKQQNKRSTDFSQILLNRRTISVRWIAPGSVLAITCTLIYSANIYWMPTQYQAQVYVLGIHSFVSIKACHFSWEETDNNYLKQ